MAYENTEHLRDWDDLRSSDDDTREDERFHCPDCGERIEAKGAACENCREQTHAAAWQDARSAAYDAAWEEVRS